MFGDIRRRRGGFENLKSLVFEFLAKTLKGDLGGLRVKKGELFEKCGLSKACADFESAHA